jgi:aminoglycoside phosphotransferase (APT) family kinase protein
MTSTKEREVIGRGRTAEILAWGEDGAMKLYVEGCGREYVQREADVSRLVHRAGLPAPAVHDSKEPGGLYEIDGRLGILYDRIDGPTMLRELGLRPWMLVAYSKELAALHAQIHAVSGEGLPSMRERIERSIDHAENAVSASARAAARRSLSRLADLRRVCHGDFHPDNVILAETGPMVIDWGPASAGHPAADVAWTLLLYRYGGTPPGTPLPIRLLIAVIRRWSMRVYLRTYSRLTGLGQSDVKAWLGVVALLRLSDGIPEERRRLIRLIEREFRGGS